MERTRGDSKPFDLSDWIRRIRDYGKKKKHLRVCEWRKTKEDDIGIYCGLIPDSEVEKALTSPGWELCLDDGVPTLWTDGRSEHGYLRFNSEPYEPLVHRRRFDAVVEDYLELTEEFRLYFNLLHDHQRQRYVRFDQAAERSEVASYTSLDKEKYLSMDVSRALIDEYLRVREMHLAIFFQITRKESVNLADLGLEASKPVLVKDTNLILEQVYYDSSGARSRLMGKIVFAGKSRSDLTLWQLDNEDIEYQRFIAGLDDSGNPLRVSCEPDPLRQGVDGFSFYSTVYFRKEVLAKYYNEPDKYRIEDGHLYCLALWVLRLDINHPDYVSTYLGDLGVMLTEKEQAYWQSFNLWPHEADRFGEEGEERRRPSYSLDVLFRQRLARFQADYFRTNAADLIRRPEAGDEYTLEALHVPLTDGQFEFDQQVLLLSKVLVDSLSEPEVERMSNLLTKGRPSAPSAAGEGRTIQKLEHMLSLARVQDPRSETEILRTIQGLRSASSAHRKGKHYLELAKSLNIKERGCKAVFSSLLEDCLRFIAVLEDSFVRLR